MMTNSMLGRLRAATIACPDLSQSLRAYRDFLGYECAESGELDSALAHAWGAPGAAGARYEWLVPASGADVGIRLIEQPQPTPFRPYSALGWNALEIAVSNCDAAVQRLSEGPFRVVGPPADLGFSDGALRAGQVVGPSGEVLYLTEIRREVPGFSLPAAKSLFDQLFIVILHAADADTALNGYHQRFGNVVTPTFQFPVDFMAEFQGLPRDHAYTLGTVALGESGYFEIDGAPAHISVRERPDHRLPPGIAMVTVEAHVNDAAVQPLGSLYRGARVARIEGVAGEWLELISREAGSA